VSVEGTVLVIGYGNPLRSDDGAGWRAAELLAADPRAAGTDVLVCHQLTPELAEDVSRASLVVLVDASTDRTAVGAVCARPLLCFPRSAPVFSHHLEPTGLLQLAAALFGRVPLVMMVTVGAVNVDPGGALSASVTDALPRVVDAVIDVIQDFRQSNA